MRKPKKHRKDRKALPERVSLPDLDATELFARGVALEKDPRNQLQAIAAYERVLHLHANHAAAHINLGSLYYDRQDYRAAEDHYREALRIDPRYALAHFDLGNVLDETGRINEAIESYLTALQLAPTYADAHYNLALTYEKIREPRKALMHWQSYVKLDAIGPWSTHARTQIKRILKADPLKLVHGHRKRANIRSKSPLRAQLRRWREEDGVAVLLRPLDASP